MVNEYGRCETPGVHLGEHGQLAFLVARQGLDYIGSYGWWVVVQYVRGVEREKRRGG
jgi:hypothetical protein